jgi:hypothetical protein
MAVKFRLKTLPERNGARFIGLHAPGMDFEEERQLIGQVAHDFARCQAV